ncbi:thioesterase II family protein [Cellulosilyticum ruminicola]|uniref:thioesterase II family protein n=1 Tax=Cellulosilyticum ruminicola TaxID=425254 RepID=UPI0006CFF8E3|nr:alpha/beta fold hydrolase [Cellulosilyticum ruminicola]
MNDIQNKKVFPFESKMSRDMEAMNVFCFQHAGGSASSYRKWTLEVLPVKIICVELPGRGMRRREKFIEDFEELTDHLAQEIYTKNNGAKFSLFGHSMGAALAFKVCYKLEKQYGISPSKLIVAGRQAPQKENLLEFKSYMGDEALIAELKRYQQTPEEIFNDNDFLNHILKEIRKDYRLNDSFLYNQEVISTPIIAHAATNDVEATKDIMKNWEQVTQESFSLREFEGNHFFVLDDQTYLSYLVKDILA